MHNYPNKAIILHGTGNSPSDNWFLWLEQKLNKMRFDVWLPELPNKDKPDPHIVVPFIMNRCPFEIDEHTLLIGHSSGAVQILHMLPKLSAPVRASFLVGAFKDNDFLNWEPNSKLFDWPFDFVKCRNNSKSIVFIHSNDDPFCPLSHAQYLSKAIQGSLMIIENQKHFSVSTMGEEYKKFDKLIEIINKYV